MNRCKFLYLTFALTSLLTASPTIKAIEGPCDSELPHDDATTIIGDSHTHLPFGETLQTQLEQRLTTCSKVKRYGFWGAKITDWNRTTAPQKSQWVCGNVIRSGAEKFGLTKTYRVSDTIKDSRDFQNQFPDFRAVAEGNKNCPFIVALGANDAKEFCADPSSPASKQAKLNAQVKSLLSTYQGRSCYWVSPPPLRTPDEKNRDNDGIEGKCGHGGSPRSYSAYKEYLSLLRNAVVASGRCQFLENEESVCGTPNITKQFPFNDGVHFDQVSGQKWGRCVADQLTPRLTTSGFGMRKSGGTM